MSGTPLLSVPGPDSVRRTFRRILSGDDLGQPHWVRLLGEPGDAGWFGPDSSAWEINGSLATLVGGVRALLLQACHPLALAGVEQHSNYREDPLGRLQRTNMFVTTTTFGSTRQAELATAIVRQVHRGVAGNAGDGRPYSASDPRLLMWVHLGLVDSMLVAAQQFHRSPVSADRYVSEMAAVGKSLGVIDPPRSEPELKHGLSQFDHELQGGPAARAVARFLQFPGRALPLGAWAPYAVLSRAAVDLLPDRAHEVLQTPRRRSVERSADATVCRGMLAGLQRILGPYSQATVLSYERLGIEPPAGG